MTTATYMNQCKLANPWSVRLGDESCYLAFQTRESTAPFRYVMSDSVPPICPPSECTPLTSECRGFGTPGGAIDVSNDLRFRPNREKDVRAQSVTELINQSVFKGRGDGHMTAIGLAAESELMAPTTEAPCARRKWSNLVGEWTNTISFPCPMGPKVESFARGGVDTRETIYCN